MRALLPILALGLATLAARPAAAQGNDAAAAATALFQEGRDAARRGDYATACVKMEESYRMDPAAGTLLNLADCQDHLGHPASAWQRFTEAVEKLPASDDRLPAVKQRIAALAARLPRLAITLAPGAPAGTHVTRDGKDLGEGSLGTALPVDPGQHVVVVTAPGRQDGRYPVDVTEGKIARLVVEPGAPLAAATTPSPAPEPGPEPTPAPPSRIGPLVIAGIAVGAAGVVTLGAAVGTGLALPGKQAIVSQHCGTPVHLDATHCDATGFAAAQSGKTLAAANTATWIAGGVAAAAGVALVVVGVVRGRKAAAVEVGGAPGFVGARIAGRFE
jgi:hypothetical protein